MAKISLLLGKVLIEELEGAIVESETRFIPALNTTAKVKLTASISLTVLVEPSIGTIYVRKALASERGDYVAEAPSECKFRLHSGSTNLQFPQHNPRFVGILSEVSEMGITVARSICTFQTPPQAVPSANAIVLDRYSNTRLYVAGTPHLVPVFPEAEALEIQGLRFQAGQILEIDAREDIGSSLEVKSTLVFSDTVQHSLFIVEAVEPVVRLLAERGNTPHLYASYGIENLRGAMEYLPLPDFEIAAEGILGAGSFADDGLLLSLSTDDPVFFRVRKLQVFVSFKNQNASRSPFTLPHNENLVLRVKKGDSRLAFVDADVYNTSIFGDAGGPYQMVSDEIFLEHPQSLVDAGSTLLCAYSKRMWHLSEHTRRPSKCAGLGICFGDLQLVVKPKSTTACSMEFFSRTHPEHPTGNWIFDIAHGEKTPLRGDSNAKTSRSEVYDVDPSVSSALFLNSDGVSLSGSLQRLVESLSKTVATVGLAQPQNVSLTFAAGTKLSIDPPSLRSIFKTATADGAVDASKTAYSSIDATLKFGAVPTTEGSRVPEFIWREDFTEPVSNFFLHREWLSGSADYSTMASMQSTFPFGFGWHAKLQSSQPNSIVRIELRKNYSASSAQPPLTLDGNLLLINEGLNQKSLPIESWWKHILSTDSNPTVPAWCGLLLWNVMLEPPLGMPKEVSEALAAVPVDLAWFDGLGATAVSNYKNDLEGSLSQKILVLKNGVVSYVPRSDVLYKSCADSENHYSLLTDCQLLINKSRVERLNLTFLWELPFFDTNQKKLDANGRPQRNFLTIKGEWIASEQKFVLTASLVKPIAVGAMGVEKIVLNQLQLSHSESDDWTITLNGDLHFTDEISQEWFDGLVEKVSFRKWSMSFSNPLSRWSVPNLSVPFVMDAQAKGFPYKLRSIELTSLVSNPQAPASPIRVWRILGDITIGAAGSSFMSATIQVPLIFKFLSNGTTDVGFGDINLTALSVNIFDLFSISGMLTWLKDRDEFQGTVKLKWSWGQNNDSIDVLFRYAANKGKPYWIAGIRSGCELDMHYVRSIGTRVVVAHHATRDSVSEDFLAFDSQQLRRSLFNESSPNLTKRTAVEDGLWLSTWKYEANNEFIVGVSVEELEIGNDVFSIREALLAICDDDLARLEGQFSLYKLQLSRFMVALDWKRKRMNASVALPEFSFGAYKADAGNLDFGFGDSFVTAGIGFPHGNDWTRAIKIHWSPTPWPIPFNEIQGGFCFAKTSSSFTTAIAMRGGYHEVIGSDGGAFGAYVSGELFIGGIVLATISGGCIEHTGLVTLDASVKGGVVVFGLKWNILSVELHAGIIETLKICSNSMGIKFGAYFTASFKVCLTPCTCLRGSIEFSYGVEATSASDFQVTNLVYRTRDALQGDDRGALTVLIEQAT